MNRNVEIPRVTWPAPSLSWIVPAVLSRRRTMMLSAAVISIAILASVVIKGPTYVVEAALLVKLGRDTSSANLAGSGETVVRTRRPEDISTEIEILASAELMSEVVDAFGVDSFFIRPPAETLFRKIKYAFSDFRDALSRQARQLLIAVGLRHPISRKDQIITVLRQSLEVDSGNRSDVIRLSMYSRDRDTGVGLLNKLIERYMQRRIALQRSDKAQNFFAAEVARIDRALETASVALSGIRQDGAAWSIPEQRTLQLDHLQKLTATQAENTSEAGVLTAEIASIDAQLATTPLTTQLSETSERSPVADQLRKELVNKEAERRRLLIRYASDSPTVRDVERRVQQLTKLLSEQRTTIDAARVKGRSPEHARLSTERALRRTELQGAIARDRSLLSALASASSELKRLNALDDKVRRLTRQIDQLEKDRTLYSENMEKARVFAAMDLAEISNVSVLAPPSASPQPVSPSLKIVAIGIVVGGLGLPFAVVLLLSFLRPVIRSRQEVLEHLGAPVLARFPEIRAAEHGASHS